MSKFALTLLVVLSGVLWAQSRPMPPDNSTANLPLQKIGPNDLIAISVYDSPEFTRSVRVGADGTIALPMVKQRVRAEGLMPGELEKAVADALQSEQILVDPLVTVTVVEYSSRPVSVAGAVKNPTTFQAVGDVSLLEAITRAGGLAPEAGSEILVTRPNPDPAVGPRMLTLRVPVKQLIDAADPSVNVKLQGGEEIRVPEVGKIFVVGNVQKPGAFPVGDGAETTVLKALALAEGLAPYAAKEAFIIRSDDKTGHKAEIPIPLKKIMKRESGDVTLAANDILYIPDNSGRRATMTALSRIAGFGAATTSGLIIWGRH